MNKTRMIFVRHGQSMGNLDGIYVGHTDSPLSEKGHLQAELTAEFLKDEKIDVFYSSDLIRAYETAVHIAKRHGKTPVPLKKMREIFGGEWENTLFSALEKKYPLEYGLWLSDIGKAKPVGGESVKELYERVNSAALEIAKKNMGKTVLTATHATPIRALMCRWRNISEEDMRLIPWVRNASVSAADYYEDGHIEEVYADVADFMGTEATRLPDNV